MTTQAKKSSKQPRFLEILGWLVPGLCITASIFVINALQIHPRKAVFVYLSLPFFFLLLGCLLNALIRQSSRKNESKPGLKELFKEARQYCLLQLAVIPAILLIVAIFLFAFGVVRY